MIRRWLKVALVAVGAVLMVVSAVVLASAGSALAGGRPAPTITCWGNEKGEDNYTVVLFERLVVRHPGNCSLMGPGVFDYDGAVLHRIKWQRWGSATVSATGWSRSLGANSPGEPTEYPAAISVSDIREHGGKCWYSHMTITSRGFTGHFTLSSPSARDYQTFGD